MMNTEVVFHIINIGGPVGKHKRGDDPIYVKFIDDCNGIKLPAPEERGIFTDGLGW